VRRYAVELCQEAADLGGLDLERAEAPVPILKVELLDVRVGYGIVRRGPAATRGGAFQCEGMFADRGADPVAADEPLRSARREAGLAEPHPVADGQRDGRIRGRLPRHADDGRCQRWNEGAEAQERRAPRQAR